MGRLERILSDTFTAWWSTVRRNDIDWIDWICGQPLSVGIATLDATMSGSRTWASGGKCQESLWIRSSTRCDVWGLWCGYQLRKNGWSRPPSVICASYWSSTCFRSRHTHWSISGTNDETLKELSRRKWDEPDRHHERYPADDRNFEGRG